jgi:hypothetical protein
VATFKRCPEHGSTDFPTINYYPDEKFCNIYHKCNCTRTECHAVDSHVCEVAKVYSRTEETCLGLYIQFSFIFFKQTNISLSIQLLKKRVVKQLMFNGCKLIVVMVMLV